jgi:predicted PurR-regulated permease PerM
VSGRAHRISIVTVIAAVAGLYFARGLLIPFALAFLLVPTLAAPVAWLQRCRMGRAPAVAIVVASACALLAVTTWFLAQQVTDLITRLPEYQAQIVAKIESLRGGVLEKATDAVNLLAAGIEATGPDDAATPPVQEVRVVGPSAIGFGSLTSGLGLLFGPLGTLTVVLLLAAFTLLRSGDLRDRIVHLMGDGNVNLTTQAMGEIGHRVGQYLRMHVVLNIVHGAGVGLGLFAFGVPNALVWGLLASLLRFIPYLGPVVATILPLAVSLAVFDGWERPLLIGAFLLGIEAVSNNLLEPWLYGKSSGVSALAVIAASVFWAWLWGPVGLVLAMPLTVAVVVVGKHVPQLRFLTVLLGEPSGIDPGVRVYQRMLAMDQADLGKVVERAFAQQKSFMSVCDTVLIPALAMAEADRHRGSLRRFAEQFIGQSMRVMVEDLGEQSRSPVGAPAAAPLPGEAAEAPVATELLQVLCVPAKSEFDHITGLMLTQALAVLGVACRLAEVDALATDKADRVDEYRSDLVCISALPPAGLLQSRYLARRLRARFPELEIVIALWGSELSSEAALGSLRIAGPCSFVTTLSEACETIRKSVESTAFRRREGARAAAAIRA